MKLSIESTILADVKSRQRMYTRPFLARCFLLTLILVGMPFEDVSGDEHGVLVPVAYCPTDTLDGKNSSLLVVQLVTGVTFQGRFHAADDSTVTYRVVGGLRTVPRTLILSVTELANIPPPRSMDARTPQTIVSIKEYNNLTYLVPAVIGGGLSVFLFSEASGVRESAQESYSAYNYDDSEELKRDAAVLDIIGSVAVAGAIVAFVYAVTPVERRIEMPVSVLATPRGVSIAIRF